MSTKHFIIENELIHFSKIEERRRLQSEIGRLDGDYRVTIRPGRGRPTDPQRGYYFGVIVQIFADYIREHDLTLTLKEAADSAHNEIKRHCLPEPVVDANGRIIADRVGSVAKIDKLRMSRLIDDSINWLGSEWNISVPPPTTLERYGEERRRSA